MVDQVEGVEHPDHYAEGRIFEPIDVINDWDLGFNLGNAVKYISRAGRKAEPGDIDASEATIRDLLKARFYLQYEIDNLNADFEIDAEIKADMENAEKAVAAASARVAAKKRRPRI
jgi:hypothetical protein